MNYSFETWYIAFSSKIVVFCFDRENQWDIASQWYSDSFFWFALLIIITLCFINIFHIVLLSAHFHYMFFRGRGCIRSQICLLAFLEQAETDRSWRDPTFYAFFHIIHKTDLCRNITLLWCDNINWTVLMYMQKNSFS